MERERGSCWADYCSASYCSCPHPLASVRSFASASDRNKVVAFNCSNGSTSSLESWPWRCMIRAGHCGLEAAPQVSSIGPVKSQYLQLNVLSLRNRARFRDSFCCFCAVLDPRVGEDGWLLCVCYLSAQVWNLFMTCRCILEQHTGHIGFCLILNRPSDL